MTSSAVIEEFLALESRGVNRVTADSQVTSPTLLYMYGPPASGKLTIAQKVAAITGSSLFHNHLTVNAISSIFPFGSAAYKAVLHRMRLDVFARAAQFNVDLIFTNNSAWGGPDARLRFEAFAEAARRVVAGEGGRTMFIRVNAPTDVLESRLADESRRANGKLLDIERLRELLANLDMSPLHEDDFEVDTASLGADDAAAFVVNLMRENGYLRHALPPEA